MTATPLIRNGPRPEVREAIYRAVAGIVTILTGVGIFDANVGALWLALATSTVTLIFALLFSTSNWRTALYAVVGPLGAVLGAYGLLHGIDWALITAGTVQAFGLSTATAKVIQVPQGRVTATAA